MPIYEYQCDACGHHFDALQKLADPELRDCPDCQAPELRKLISAPSFRLAGAGWYETDFKTDRDKKRNLAGDAAAPKDKSAATESKSDSKSDSTSESKRKPKAGSDGGKAA